MSDTRSPDQIAHELFKECTVDLIADLGGSAAVEPIPEPDVSSMTLTLAMLGFSSDVVVGSVSVIADLETLVDWRKLVVTGASSPEEARDWSGELANQLAGRLKNRMLRAGVCIYLATPVCVTGQQLEITTVGQPHWSRVRTPLGVVQVSLAIQASDAWALYTVPSGREIAAEGDLVLF